MKFVEYMFDSFVTERDHKTMPTKKMSMRNYQSIIRHNHHHVSFEKKYHCHVFVEDIRANHSYQSIPGKNHHLSCRIIPNRSQDQVFFHHDLTHSSFLPFTKAGPRGKGAYEQISSTSALYQSLTSRVETSDRYFFLILCILGAEILTFPGIFLDMSTSFKLLSKSFSQSVASLA